VPRTIFPQVDPDITVASTLEGSFYSDAAMFARMR